jgi:ABC-type uncharacterized transport system substrate-binding protein
MVRNVEEVIGYVYKFSEVNIKESTKILLRLDSIQPNNKFIANSTNIINKALKLDELDLNLGKFFLSAYMKINSQEIKNKIKEQLILKTYDPEFVPFLYDMYHSSGDKRFAEKLINICKNTNMQYDDEIISFAIKHLEDKKQDLKEFLYGRGLGITSCKTL